MGSCNNRCHIVGFKLKNIHVFNLCLDNGRPFLINFIFTLEQMGYQSPTKKKSPFFFKGSFTFHSHKSSPFESQGSWKSRNKLNSFLNGYPGCARKEKGWTGKREMWISFMPTDIETLWMVCIEDFLSIFFKFYLDFMILYKFDTTFLFFISHFWQARAIPCVTFPPSGRRCNLYLVKYFIIF